MSFNTLPSKVNAIISSVQVALYVASVTTYETTVSSDDEVVNTYYFEFNDMTTVMWQVSTLMLCNTGPVLKKVSHIIP